MKKLGHPCATLTRSFAVNAALVILFTAIPQAVHAQYTVVHRFADGSQAVDGERPNPVLTLSPLGIFGGTQVKYVTATGTIFNQPTLFMLQPDGSVDRKKFSPWRTKPEPAAILQWRFCWNYLSGVGFNPIQIRVYIWAVIGQRRLEDNVVVQVQKCTAKAGVSEFAPDRGIGWFPLWDRIRRCFWSGRHLQTRSQESPSDDGG